MVAKGKERQPTSHAHTLFPCASGVTMPQLGAEDAEIRKHLRKPAPTKLVLKPDPVDDTPVDKRYLKKISTEMKFAEDVVKERCFYMMPYDSKYLLEALDVSNIVSAPKRVRVPVGRHNASGTDLRHMPCGVPHKPPPLKPLKKKIARKALAMSIQVQGAGSESGLSSQTEDTGRQKPQPEVFLTEVAQDRKEPEPQNTLQDLQAKLKDLRAKAAAEAEERQRPKSARIRAGKPKKEWDAFLMSQLSQLTATWIVHERMPATRHQDDLQKTLEDWYGKPSHTDLVQEDGSEGEEDFAFLDKDKPKKVKKKWKKAEASLLERVYATSAKKPEAHDPYSDDNLAPFYRQPAGIRRQKKRHEKEEAGAINATAHNIKVKSQKVPKPPSLRDFIAPGVGSTLHETDNQYEQELLAGVHQSHPATGENNAILVMASDHKYKKVFRKDYPEDAHRWYPPTDEEKEKSEFKETKSEHGAKRWQALPEPYDDEAQTVVPPGYEPEFRCTVDPNTNRQVKQNNTLTQILHDWRSKWNLSGQYADATYNDIIKDMADIQPHVRLKAIATVGKAAEYKPPVDPGIQIGSHSNQDDPLTNIPEEVFVGLECLLGDTHSQVQRAAAITLYALERPVEKAQQILRSTLESESSTERWAAAQCLAHFGVCDSQVVEEIMKQILASEDPIKHEQGIALLAKISNSTTLVHCMVAEQLNSSSWRYRVIACKILPTLYGNINKDVTHKLTELMWHDWHTEVRRAAAQCLGKTSHGRDVHDDIRRCIMYGNERTKLEAISRLGQLGIMTAKLLPAFLQCFDDKYVSIRSECCITCGNLQIKEEQVIDKLVHLATFDPIWKVKALAIQALGKIGEVTDAIKECLLWAMRYEEKAGVRAEACHSLKKLDIMDEDVIQILQERLLVESSQVVRDEMMEAMQSVGLSAAEDMDMVTQIKGEVRKLCKQNIIASQIVLNEADEMRQENLNNMIYQSKEELERWYPKRNNYLKMLQMEEYKEYLHVLRKNSACCHKEKADELKEMARQRLRSLASASEKETAASQVSEALPSKEASAAKARMGVARESDGEDQSSLQSHTTTPEPYSREATMFTPSADKELEAILGREDVPPSLPPSGESQSSKSRPVTGETETSGTYTSPETMSRTSKPSLPEEYIEEVDRQLACHDNTQHLAITPARSRLGLSPSASVMDMKGSVLSLTQLSGRRTVVSRETLREREKLDEHINATYAGLSARYADMVQDLNKIDVGLNMGPPMSSSKFLKVPGEGLLMTAPVPPLPLNQAQAAPTDSSDSVSGEESTEDNSTYFSGDVSSNAAAVAGGSEQEEEEQADGQVALSLEVPISEHVSEQSPNAAQLVESGSDSRTNTSATQYSTEYPSLKAEDIAQHLLDVETSVAPSTYDGSTPYYGGVASEYANSARSGSGSDDATLD